VIRAFAICGSPCGSLGRRNTFGKTRETGVGGKTKCLYLMEDSG